MVIYFVRHAEAKHNVLEKAAVAEAVAVAVATAQAATSEQEARDRDEQIAKAVEEALKEVRDEQVRVIQYYTCT